MAPTPATDTSTNETPERAEPISLSIFEAVADAEGVDPVDLDPPPATVVDPTAIDRLFPDREPTRAAWNG